MTNAAAAVPGLDDVNAAARRLEGHAIRTPLLWAPEIDAVAGGRVLIKAECLQRTGSFKFRGAFNAIAQLPDDARRRGVLAWSSGNHAQAVAAAAAHFGCRAVIVMPADAPAVKIANTRALGGEVVLYDRATQSREAIGMALAAERGLDLIKPYDDGRIIAGQGTAGLEAVEQAAQMGLEIGLAIAPASGGGLVAGTALAVRGANPTADIWAAEPAGFDDLRLSLEAGRPTAVPPPAGPAPNATLCDALMATMPGDIPFALHRRMLAGSVAVDDTMILGAMRTAFDRLKIVLEPGGGAALAAVLAGAVPTRDRVTLVVASGGNVDVATFRQALDAPPLT